MKRHTSLLPCILVVLGIAAAQNTECRQATPQTPSASSLAPRPATGEELWAGLMEGNKRFIAGKPKATELPLLRRRLAQGQHPQVVVLTCSDSRVPPELLFDKTLGDLFVVRAAGNVADSVGLGSIEYAVEHLGARLLVVLGHEKCGAVTAACSSEKMPTPSLQAIVDKISPAVAQASSYAAGNGLVDAAIKENTHQSAKDVLANSSVLQESFKEGKLTVIEAIYKLETGEVVRLGKLSLVEPVFKLNVGDVVRVE